MLIRCRNIPHAIAKYNIRDKKLTNTYMTHYNADYHFSFKLITTIPSCQRILNCIFSMIPGGHLAEGGSN